ncbi:MAG: hybrid sensor histidine kinase/response regulator [Deltaproteobacteria bacterium]|nr:hybrid sensor histidine kinase/response regulator [Deltaproteobacteria bacterium]
MVSVLVVDDERDFADVLTERLAARGVQAQAAYNGTQALEMVREHRPEVVLLDINMPGMNGLETLERIKAQSPRTEVVLLTADSALTTAVAGMKLGARDYLLKPADIDEVLGAIGEADERRAERLARQRMAETAKLAALGEMAKGVGHEINNPMHVMLNEAGWISDLLDEPDLRDNPHHAELRAAVKRIQEQARRCKAITAKLLTLRCSLDTRVADTDLAELVRAVLKERQARLEGLSVRAVVDMPPDLPKLGSPRSEWEQVLSNLVDNALDAMEHEGGELRISATLDKDAVLVSVADTGCGIEAHVLPKIFEPFFSTKEVGKGIGLGLAICHGIVEAMGGEISVRATPGAGSEFTIRVPLDTAARTAHNDKHLA